MMEMWRRILIICFFSCPFALNCWAKLNFVCNMGLNIDARVVDAYRNDASDFFLEAFIIATWEIWNLRNSIIFDNGVASVNFWARNFKSQGYLQLVRVQRINKLLLFLC
jgi:hypothetical protein